MFKTKLNHDDSIERHKARLVAKGFTQKKGFDYYETYAPVACMASIRIIAAIAANNGWKLLQIDIPSAYLNGKIDCDIYISQPPGYIDENNPLKVWLLLKSLYGLKQAGKIWNGVLVAFLLENGFIQSLSDICIFICIDKNGYIILGVYVDDLQYAGNESATIKFLAQVTATFEMRDLGEAKLILRVQVDQDKSGIQLHQATYIQSIIDEYHLHDAKSVPVPISPTDMGDLNADSSPVDSKLYHSILGKIMYAMTSTRPDIAFAVSTLAKFSSAPTAYHMAMLMKLLRYLKGTINMCLYYPNRDGKEILFNGYTDSNHASPLDDYKSRTGYVFLINKTPITWCSKRQATVAISSTEAEYVSASQSCREAIWLRSLLKDIKHSQEHKATIIYEDNQGAIALSKNPQNHQRTKHINVHYHYIREKSESNEICLEYINTSEQAADIFTKALPKPVFNKLLDILGMKFCVYGGVLEGKHLPPT